MFSSALEDFTCDLGSDMSGGLVLLAWTHWLCSVLIWPQPMQWQAVTNSWVTQNILVYHARKWQLTTSMNRTLYQIVYTVTAHCLYNYDLQRFCCFEWHFLGPQRKYSQTRYIYFSKLEIDNNAPIPFWKGHYICPISKHWHIRWCVLHEHE